MSTQSLIQRTEMPVSAEELFAWHQRPGAFDRLNPPWEKVKVVRTEQPFGDGHRVTLSTPILGPIRTSWVAEVYDFEPGRQFRDRQITGPFASFEHTHRMIPEGSTRSLLEDRVDYRLPMGFLGRLLGGRVVRKKLESMFAYRHRLTLSDLTRHAKYHDRPRLTVAITGSRGMIGSALTRFLTTGGHRVVRLVHGGRGKPSVTEDGTRWVNWDAQSPLDPMVLEGCNSVIHLAGDNIAEGRWSAAKKRRIMETRTIPTRFLAEAMAALDRPPEVFVSASAVGIYGDRGDEELTEDAAIGTGFLAEVGKAWEDAAAPASAKGIRVVHPRIGVVLSPAGGALGKQLFPFRMGAGATLGSGKQWVSWISLDDIIGAFHHVLMQQSLTGPVNFTAPNPVTNRTFGKVLGKVLARPVFMWLPGFALRVMFGEMANAALLASMRALPQKLQRSGFEFDYPDLESALRHMLGR